MEKYDVFESEDGYRVAKGKLNPWYATKKEANFAASVSKAAAALARIKTAKKAASSRENGKKGGRPKANLEASTANNTKQEASE